MSLVFKLRFWFKQIEESSTFLIQRIALFSVHLKKNYFEREIRDQYYQKNLRFKKTKVVFNSTMGRYVT